MKEKMQDISRGRNNLRQLSHRMENIVTYRRYNGRDLDDD